jgi:hypothetical protein
LHEWQPKRAGGKARQPLDGGLPQSLAARWLMRRACGCAKGIEARGDLAEGAGPGAVSRGRCPGRLIDQRVDRLPLGVSHTRMAFATDCEAVT